MKRFALLVLLCAGMSRAQTITDAGFERPTMGAGKFAYRTVGSAWTFTGTAGVSGNGSAFTGSNPNAPEGAQIALVQNAGRLSQAVTWPAGSYQLSFRAAQRNFPAAGSTQRLDILVDGQTVGSIAPAGTSYRVYYSSVFAVADPGAPGHTLTIQGAGLAGDNTAFIDAITITAADAIKPGARVQDAWIGTSGKTVGFRFIAADGSSVPLPIQPISAPQLYRNGLSLGPLGPAANLGDNEAYLFPLAAGDVIGANDIVTASAVAGWVNTSAGLCERFAGRSIANRAGRSIFPPEAVKPRTLRPGVNCNLGPTAYWGHYWPFKNWAFKVGWPPGNLGKIRGNATQLVYSNAGNNGIDATGYPGPAGLWLVYWHPTGNQPASFTLGTTEPSSTLVTERAGMGNPAAPGGYLGRVFEFARQPNSTTVNIDVALVVNDPSGQGAYDDLWVVGPGDFDAAPGVPVTLDTSDPFALSCTFSQWTRGAGSLRWVDSSACGGNPTSCPYPELLLRATDRNWGDLGFRTIRYGFKAIGPVDPAVTPWMYSPRFKDRFPATLAESITTTPAVGTLEVYQFSDAATAPLMAGLEITVDSEVMRILTVTGSSVKLYRGSNGTTPAKHAAGVVQVSGRKPLAIPPNGIIPQAYTYQLTTREPHGITTGVSFTTAGNWPQVTWDNGEVTGRLDARYPLVTGPNTLVSWIGPTTKRTGTKPAKVVPLDPAQAFSEVRYGGYIPLEVTAIATAKLPGAALHLNINQDACDDLVWTVFRWVRDNFPAGRSVIVEYTNEPWNWAFTGFEYVTKSSSYFAPSNPYTLSYYCQRAGEIGAVGRAVFGPRASEIKLMVNCQLGSDQAKQHLAHAARNGWTIDRIGIAPYLECDTAAGAFKTWDDDQLCDLWPAFLWYSRQTSGLAFNGFADQVQGYIKDHNAATGGACRLMAYEGGISQAAPGLARSIDLVYNPNWYWFEDTFYRWLDRWQFAEAHVYSLSQYHSPYVWGLYHWPRQKPGYGDGRSGGSDNRARLARSKPAGVNVDYNDSVRGQAFLDWNREAPAR